MNTEHSRYSIYLRSDYHVGVLMKKYGIFMAFWNYDHWALWIGEPLVKRTRFREAILNMSDVGAFFQKILGKHFNWRKKKLGIWKFWSLCALDRIIQNHLWKELGFWKQFKTCQKWEAFWLKIAGEKIVISRILKKWPRSTIDPWRTTTKKNNVSGSNLKCVKSQGVSGFGVKLRRTKNSNFKNFEKMTT